MKEQAGRGGVKLYDREGSSQYVCGCNCSECTGCPNSWFVRRAIMASTGTLKKKGVEGGLVGGKEGSWRGFAVKATNRRRADCKVRMTDAPHTRRDSS